MSLLKYLDKFVSKTVIRIRYEKNKAIYSIGGRVFTYR